MTFRESTRKQSDWTRKWWFNSLLILATFSFLLFARLHINQPFQGDEPGYLLMNYSLEHDGDFNLKNNYIQKDYIEFSPNMYAVPAGNPKIINMSKDKLYSIHSIGLSLLLVPGFWLNVMTGSRIEMVILATFVIWLSWVWCYQITKKRISSYVAAGSLAICFFFTGLAGTLYPDMAIAAATLSALILLESHYKKLWAQVLLGIALGFMVLLHYRTLNIILPALLILSYKTWHSSRKLPWLTFLIVAAFIAHYFLTLHFWFGVWNPKLVFGADATQFLHTPQTTLSAMLFDSYRGLLVYNPILLLVFIGLPLWYYRNRKSILTTLIIVLPSIVTLTLYRGWTGPYAPTGRYVMDFVPIFLPAVAFAIHRMHTWWQRTIVATLIVTSFVLSLDNILNKFPLSDGMAFSTKSIPFMQLKYLTGIAFNNWLPTYSNDTALLSQHSFIKLLACYFVVFGLVVYGWFLAKTERIKKA